MSCTARRFSTGSSRSARNRSRSVSSTLGPRDGRTAATVVTLDACRVDAGSNPGKRKNRSRPLAPRAQYLAWLGVGDGEQPRKETYVTTVSESKVSTLHLDLPAPAREALQRALEACLTCVETCTACADACLREEDVSAMRACILSDLDCADVCDTTAKVLARSGGAQVGITRA